VGLGVKLGTAVEVGSDAVGGRVGRLVCVAGSVGGIVGRLVCVPRAVGGTVGKLVCVTFAEVGGTFVKVFRGPSVAGTLVSLWVVA
jgi:hypothetical protein